MAFDKFIEELKINGRGNKTIALYKSILNEAERFKELPGWTKEDVNTFILSRHTEGYKKSTIEMNKLIIKKFFKWAGEPGVVDHLEVKLPKNDLKREDILTVDDVNRMIETTESPMYKALLAFLFESGCRENEALKLKVEDVQETDKGMLISVHDTKTGKGYRRGLYIYSATYIRNHITYSGLSKGDRLFDIQHTQAWRMLKHIGEKAGLEKPVSPHKFRHAQATDMVLRGYQEMIIRKKLGWTDDSRMIARYQHIIDDDVINSTLEKAGTDIPRQPTANLKQAESLNIANASLQLSKLASDNEELKQVVPELFELKDVLKATTEENQQLKKEMSELREWVKDQILKGVK